MKRVIYALVGALIPSSVTNLVSLAKMICKVRFGSAESLRAHVINPKTKKMVKADRIREALAKQGLINKCVQKGQLVMIWS